jgi:hypothetical protein
MHCAELVVITGLGLESARQATMDSIEVLC